MGANIDKSVNDGRGPPVFKIHGQVHHRIGSLLPPDGSAPKFIQLYIYDTANEVRNRLSALHPADRNDEPLDPDIVQELIKMLDDHNPFAQKFRMARDRLQEHGDEEFIIRIVGADEGDVVQYNLPSTDELAMLVVGDFTLDNFKRDIIIESRSGHLRQISSLHPAYMALQYPLLFPYGERGFQVGILYSGADTGGNKKRVKMTMQDYYRYHFHYRKGQPNPFLCYGLLSSQAKVDARAAIDENRLWFILKNQDKFRVENLQGIADAVGRGCIDGSEMGKLTILPASHTGGRRYMVQNYHDGVAICRVFGPPDFFITFTCNPNWEEITLGILEPGQKPTDRADIVVRVYNMKLEELLDDLRSGKIFGPVAAGKLFSFGLSNPEQLEFETVLSNKSSNVLINLPFHTTFLIAALHTVEFQKRGLPHAHIIIWLVEDTTNPTPALIDHHISAEIPDPKEDPLGYALVADHMIHGPCGVYNPNAPCMKDGKCSKGFPKNFQEETTIDQNGFSVYKRPDNGRFVIKGTHKLSNQWVVPHNLYLLKKYQAHINIEWCNKGIFIKYLFKYVTKGPDCSKIYLQRLRNGEDVPEDEETQARNEVKEYLDCRYICEQDACWRIFGFDIHRHYPAVERLPVHLPYENNINYDTNANMAEIVSDEFLKKTMLTEWFTANRTYESARSLTYLEFPSKWRWVKDKRIWEPRQSKGKIGRLYYVHPSVGERYYLRILLMTVKGAQSYEDVRTYEGITYPTFKAACNARGLLGNDQEWYNAFDEAAAWATSPQLRQLFVTMLLFCEVTDEYAFFEKVWRLMADDIQYQFKENIVDNAYVIPEPT
jgi:hypothetical protein